MKGDLSQFIAGGLLLLAACSSATTDLARDDDDDGAAARDASTAADATPADAASRFDASDASDAPDVGDAGPCPAQMALVRMDGGQVCVDRYEGALVVRAADGGESPWSPTESIDAEDASTFRAIPAEGIQPQAFVSANQAEAACENAGKRLCSLAEWTAACRGQPDHDYLYPYGDTYEPGACNEGRATSPVEDLYGPNAQFTFTELNDPRNDQLPDTVAKGGAFPRCVSAYGTFDMHGNLHEWVHDEDAPDPSHGTFMGGYFVDAKINGAGCTYRTTAHATSYHDYSTGFRCCVEPW